MIGEMGRSCVFCNGVPVTREHVFPRWIQHALGVRGKLTLSVGDRVLRTVPEFNLTVRIVCAECNHGWLADLERDVHRIIRTALHGLPTVLGRDDQRLVALWAVKTWVLVEQAFAHERGGALRSPELFPWLRTHREPPPFIQVRLGAVDAQRRQVAWVATLPVGTPPSPPVGVMGVFAVGYLLVHLYVPIVEPAPKPVHLLELGPRLQPYLRTIWPPEIDQVTLPPDRVFTISDLDREWPGGGHIEPGLASAE